VLVSIKKEQAIKSLLSKGARVYGKDFTVCFILMSEGLAGCSGFVVLAGKKFFTTAVKRNFVKRRMRAMLRQAYCEGLVPQNVALSISAKTQLLEADFAATYRQFKRALREVQSIVGENVVRAK
jgi:ribonuclease P protein component